MATRALDSPAAPTPPCCSALRQTAQAGLTGHWRSRRADAGAQAAALPAERCRRGFCGASLALAASLCVPARAARGRARGRRARRAARFPRLGGATSVANDVWAKLGLEIGDDKVAIRRAYKKFVLTNHPDVRGDTSPDADAVFAEKFEEITKAYKEIMKADEDLFWLESFNARICRLTNEREERWRKFDEWKEEMKKKQQERIERAALEAAEAALRKAKPTLVVPPANVASSRMSLGQPLYGAQLSAVAWIKTTSAFGPVIAQWREGDGNAVWGLWLQGGRLFSWLSSDGFNNPSVVGRTPVNDGAWHMVGLTHSAATRVTSLFVDGVLDASAVTVGPLFASSSEDIHIGAQESGGGWELADYEIGNVMLVGRTLSEVEMKVINGGVLPLDFPAYERLTRRIEEPAKPDVAASKVKGADGESDQVLTLALLVFGGVVLVLGLIVAGAAAGS